MRFVRDVFMITIGSFIISFGVNEFIVPAHLITSGLAGICVILYNLFGWSIGTQFLLYNIPLLILGYRFVGRRFTAYTVLAVILQSAFLNLLTLPHHLTNDPLLASVFGGIAVGFGSGLILRYDGAAGGFDIASRLLASYSGVGFGTTNLVINGFIILASAFLFDFEAALYTLISIFVTSKTYDTVLHHMDKISLIIMTNHGDSVEAFLRRFVNVEATLFHAEQTTRQRKRQMVYSIIVDDQLHEIKQAVLEVDPDAIISIIPTRDVIGGQVRRW